MRENIEKNWGRISSSIRDVLDFIREKTYIKCDKALTSYNAMIPLIYFRYHLPDAWNKARSLDTYLLRCLLIAFGRESDALLRPTDKIQETATALMSTRFLSIRSQNRSLELTPDRLWQMGYGSAGIHLLFNLWYRDFEYVPSYENNAPQVDHIFPQSALRGVTTRNSGETGRAIMRYRDAERNQLANCSF